MERLDVHGEVCESVIESANSDAQLQISDLYLGASRRIRQQATAFSDV
jgi:hypothetical protein